MTTVIGLDPSLTGTGVCVLRFTVRDPAPARCCTQTIGSKGHVDDPLMARERRISHVVDVVRELLLRDVGTPTAPIVGIEGFTPGFGRERAFNELDRHALWWDLVRLTKATVGTYPIVIPPSNLKQYATGKGNAGKDAVMAAAIKRYLWLEVRNNNEADAVVIAAMAARLYGQPVEASMPQTHLAALKKLALN